MLAMIPVAAVIAALAATFVPSSNVRAAVPIRPVPAVLIANGAPLTRVLGTLATSTGEEARVDDGVTDRVSGTLSGEPDELIELLAETHGLELYRDENVLWFDRAGRTIVDFVPLAKPDIVRALEVLAAPVAPGGTVQVEAAGRGLVLSGSRGYVRTSLKRIVLATGLVVEPVRSAPDLLAPAIGEAAPRPQLDGIPVLISVGNPPFVETADGTRLPLGAELADGRRLSGIERTRLVFERDGEESALALP